MSIRNVDNEESKVKPKRSLPPSFARPFKELCHGQEQITGKMLSRPQISFHGQIHVIDTIDIADQHAADICKQAQKHLGFDIEWKPSFVRDKPQNAVSLLQLCTESTVYLFRLCKIGLPSSLKEILESKEIRKVGLNCWLDARKLDRDYGIDSKGFVDVGDFANKLGITRLLDDHEHTSTRWSLIALSETILNETVFQTISN
eukprot:TRINITY_DN4807_c0_g1_i2.p1 TRINITY_DN4807_c0_g1~~TRINITY_DN4807_c0_g1_i2.p1  ORF type:complete len:202 (-),score=41.00 TRINITY_DN4807_c0_g1_i2:123-728(-)